MHRGDRGDRGDRSDSGNFVIKFHADQLSRAGFLQCRYVASGPLVRSSYRAGEFFVEAMIKQDKGASVPALV